MVSVILSPGRIFASLARISVNGRCKMRREKVSQGARPAFACDEFAHVDAGDGRKRHAVPAVADPDDVTRRTAAVAQTGAACAVRSQTGPRAHDTHIAQAG